METALLPPNVPSAAPVTQPEQPEMSDTATAGLSGAAPTVGGPAMEGPAQPHVSVARHILDALGGSGGGPMDWAKSTIAGALAGAANVGKVPEGAGWLAGASRGAQGVQELQRQKMLDQQKQQQQQFENQEKQKADERAERQETRADKENAALTAWQNAQTYASGMREQREQTEFSEKRAELAQQALSHFKAADLDLSQYPEVKNLSDMTPQQKQDVLNHKVLAVNNGATPKPGENDDVGYHLVPVEEVKSARFKTDQKIPNGVDEKGNPQYKTVSAGTSLWDAQLALSSTQEQLATLQKSQEQQAKLQEQQANAKTAGVKAEHAEANEALGETEKKAQIRLTNADIGLKGAEAEKARAEATQAGDKPIYAYNQKTGQTELVTHGQMNANPGTYTNPVPVKQGDIEKDKEASLQLGDAQMNLTRAKLASDKFQNLSMSDRVAVSTLTSKNDFKVGFMGTSLPTDWINKLTTDSNFASLSPEARSAVVGYLGLRSAVIAYQRAVTKSGRSSDKQLQIEEDMLPDPGADKTTRDAMLNRFQENVDQVAKGLPLLPGVDRPADVRSRLEKEDAAKAGATHVYDPATATAKPIQQQGQQGPGFLSRLASTMKNTAGYPNQ
jgi:hypothetical protein